MPRTAKLSIALMLAYAVLKPHSSPWLPAAWDKRDVFFWVDNHRTVIAVHPFLVSLTGTEDGSVAETVQFVESADSLFSPGILIMELWFTPTIESQPCWEANFGPDGKETEFACFTAAVTWQRMVNEDTGFRLHKITWRCIYGNFGTGTQDLGNEGFARPIYEGVVRELEEFVAIFEP
jgi:hypothetical protein